jgi:diguanylate cyclase (GGDEF)-like protein/PAS domain S-box-containing protein
MAWIKIDKERLLNKTYLETLINNSQDLIWFKDIKGSHDKVNDAFCRAVNKPKSVVEGRGHYFIWDITPDEYSKGEFVCLESEQDVMKEKRTMIFDEKVKTADGMRQLLTVKSPMFDEFGNIMGTVGCAKDVTDINNISREISIFFENIPFGVIISDADDIICEVNTNMEMMSGYKKDVILGTKVDMDYPKIKKEVTDSQDQNVDIVEFTVGGEQKILEMTKVEITDVFKKFIGIMRFFKDVTQERNLEIQVLHNANTDFLTGLYNRRYFYNYVKENCIGKPISLIFMDLDNFKRVNDTYGHQAGDDALVLTADILRKNCNDGLIVRNGGDEFIVVINNSADIDKLEERTKHLMSDFETAFKNDKRFVNVSASMGLSAVDKLGENGNNIDEIIKKSDAALYLAKNTKKGSYRIAEIN